MMLTKITGKMLRAGRVFADLTQDQLAARAGAHEADMQGFEREGPGESIPALAKTTRQARRSKQ